jgi:hypothetical protein
LTRVKRKVPGKCEDCIVDLPAKFETRDICAGRARLVCALAVVAALILAAGAANAATIEIVRPQHEETIQDNEGNVEVTVRADLGRDQRIRVLMDGEPVAPESERRTIRITNVERGEHVLKAQVVSDRGRVVAESRPVVFYMWQASALFPGRTPPPPAEPPPPPPQPKPQTAPLTREGAQPSPQPQTPGAPLGGAR